MLMVGFAFLAIVCSVSAAPSRGKRFEDFDRYVPYHYPSRSFAGAYAGAGYPFYMPYYFNPWYIPMPDLSQFAPWYTGPNVCSKRKVFSESEEMKKWLGGRFDSVDYEHSSESCYGDNKAYICKKRVQTNEGTKLEATIYECCDGFSRDPEGPGCIEIDLRNLMPTLRNMGASQLVKVVEKMGMVDDFHNNNYTIFCPPNSALEEIQKAVEDDIDNDIVPKMSQQKLKKKTRIYNIITSHLSPGFFKTSDLLDGSMLPTGNANSKIRINMYFTPLRVITANCVPIISEDNFARNGIVHVVEKVLPMPSKTVADIVAGDTQFTTLKRMLSVAGLVQTLRNPNGSYTMFAPTDSALKSLSYQSGESDNRCTVSLMKHHIVNHVICSTALPQHARSLNMIGELLTLNRDQHNKLYVDDVQVVVRDLMATNGVVHIIDGILSARQTKPISEVLDESGLQEFLSLTDKAHVKSEFDSLENVTFFIPTDEVLKSIPPRHLEALLKHNNHSLQDVLRYHVVNGHALLKSSGQLLKSQLGNSSVRFQVYTKYPERAPQILAQCATVLSADIKFCGGTLHVIDKLLLPPKLTIIDFLESIEGFSTLVLLLRVTRLDKRLKNDQSAFTLFAPTDDAFHQMGQEAIFRILEDITTATDLVKMHIVQGPVCCSQLNNEVMSGRHQTRTMEGSLLNLGRSVDSVLTAGGAHVVECDIMATNGVIHMVDAVLSHERAPFLGGRFFDNIFAFV